MPTYLTADELKSHDGGRVEDADDVKEPQNHHHFQRRHRTPGELGEHCLDSSCHLSLSNTVLS